MTDLINPIPAYVRLLDAIKEATGNTTPTEGVAEAIANARLNIAGAKRPPLLDAYIYMMIEGCGFSAPELMKFHPQMFKSRATVARAKVVMRNLAHAPEKTEAEKLALCVASVCHYVRHVHESIACKAAADAAGCNMDRNMLTISPSLLIAPELVVSNWKDRVLAP